MYPIWFGPPTTLRTFARYAAGCLLATSYAQLLAFQTSHGPTEEPTGILLTTLPNFRPAPKGPADVPPLAVAANAVRPQMARTARSLTAAGRMGATFRSVLEMIPVRFKATGSRLSSPCLGSCRRRRRRRLGQRAARLPAVGAG